MEKCGKKFQSRRNLSQHVREHKPELQASSSAQVVIGQDQSELDLIALLSCVAEEDLKLNEPPQPGELITVDASAITPIKNNESSKDPPNIISKSRRRKRKQSNILKSSKKDNITTGDASTINMQDLV